MPNYAQAIASGFYRVQNYGSSRYAYVCDNTGSINIANTSADMGAIALFNKEARDYITDPASVIYANYKGKNNKYEVFDLEAQGTSVYGFIQHYVTIVKGGVSGTWWVYEPTYSMYLWDEVRSTLYTQSYVGTDPVKKGSTVQNDYKCWNVLPISHTTDNFLGIAPNSSIKQNGKYYKSFYMAFPFNLKGTGMKAYYVSEVKKDAVIIKEIAGTIPAKTPVIIECSSSEATNNRVELLYTTVSAISDNKLSGNMFCYADHGTSAYKVYNANTMRVLGVKDGKLQYVTDTKNQYITSLLFQNGDNSQTKYCLNANESYLSVAAGTAADLPVMTEAEYEELHRVILGDINGDRKVDNSDIKIIYESITKGITALQKPEADINGDGRINIVDVNALYQIINSSK